VSGSTLLAFNGVNVETIGLLPVEILRGEGASNASLINIESTEHLEDLVSKNQNGLLVFFASSWCVHCQACLRPYHILASRFHSALPFAFFNATTVADGATELKRRYGIQSFPAVTLFKGKESFERLARKSSCATLLRELAEFIGSHVDFSQADRSHSDASSERAANSETPEEQQQQDGPLREL
jgi:thioredoxin-like negative regulator of GroEL